MQTIKIKSVLKGKELIRTKMAVNNNVIEQVRNFNYLGCHSISDGN
jgi:hypothetical protein